MPKALSILLDQNIPIVTARWLRGLKPLWKVMHANEVGLVGKSDEELFEWAQAQKAVMITYL